MNRCDGEVKFPKIYKNARQMLKNLKNPNTGKKLIVDERLLAALKRFDAKFGAFHCKLIACVREETTEMLLTSANFHNWHFHYDHSDMVVYFRLPTDDFRDFYLEPLGLAPRFGSMPLMPRDTSSTLSTGSARSSTTASHNAFPILSAGGSPVHNGGMDTTMSSSQINGPEHHIDSDSSGSITPTSGTPSHQNTSPTTHHTLPPFPVNAITHHTPQQTASPTASHPGVQYEVNAIPRHSSSPHQSTSPTVHHSNSPGVHPLLPFEAHHMHHRTSPTMQQVVSPHDPNVNAIPYQPVSYQAINHTAGGSGPSSPTDALFEAQAASQRMHMETSFESNTVPRQAQNVTAFESNTTPRHIQNIQTEHKQTIVNTYSESHI